MNIIWSNEYDDIKALQKDLIEEEGLAESDALYRAYELNDEYLYDERANLNIHVGEDIIAIADLGLWNGRRQGYKLLKSDNIRDCLSGTCGDYIKWYVDDLGDLCCDDSHHDGTNNYLYRSWKPGLSETAKENFLEKIYEGKATRADITRCTRRLGDYIARVYGWKLRGTKAS